jgi:hypothetical protein
MNRGDSKARRCKRIATPERKKPWRSAVDRTEDSADCSCALSLKRKKQQTAHWKHYNQWGTNKERVIGVKADSNLPSMSLVSKKLGR